MIVKKTIRVVLVVSLFALAAWLRPVGTVSGQVNSTLTSTANGEWPMYPREAACRLAAPGFSG